MYNIYFPPCGFGFWYELGILNSNKYENCNLYGSSAGSLICLLSLLDKEERNIYNILNDCIDIKNIIYSKSSFAKLNLYNYSSLLCEKIIKKLEKKELKKINEKLDKIYIEVTEIKLLYGIIPYITSEYIKPKNLLELKNLILGSCYIPLLSFYKNIFYYKFNNKYYIDGYIGSFINKDKENIIKINCSKYISLIPCNKKIAIELYNNGLNNNIKVNDNNIILKIYYIIYYSLKNLINLFI